MKIEDIRVQNINGLYCAALVVERSKVQVEEFEGKGETLAEAMYDLGDYLQAAKL